jgi:hypothetical protein
MNFALIAPLTTGSLFLCILGLMEVGRRLGQRRIAEDAEGARAGVGAIDGAVYGLLGLLIAFSFSGAAERFAGRRALIVEEANAIGTAYLRVDLLPEEAQSAMRDRFRRYVDARLEAYAKVPDMEAAMAALARSTVLQAEIWSEAQRSSRSGGAPAAGVLLLPALNEMFDITTTRLAATRAHPPMVIFVMLVILALVSALLAGYGMAEARRRHWMHPMAYAAVMAVTIYVILDLEYPRVGLIRVDAADQLLHDVRAGMN